MKRLRAVTIKNISPPFSPPKPKLARGIQALLHCLSSTLAAFEVEDSIRRTFVKFSS